MVAVAAGPRGAPHADAPAATVITVAGHAHVSTTVTPSASVAVATAPPADAHDTQCPLKRTDRASPAAHAPTAGLGAGVTEAVLVVTPFEVVKIRLQQQVGLPRRAGLGRREEREPLDLIDAHRAHL